MTFGSRSKEQANCQIWKCLQDVRWVEEQLFMLGTLLPDLIEKLPKMKAGLLLALVKDTEVFCSPSANMPIEALGSVRTRGIEPGAHRYPISERA